MCLSDTDGAREYCRFVELESMALESLSEFQNKFLEVQVLLESKKLKNRKREVPISKEPF